MAEGRATEARERAESPAQEAGLSGSEPRTTPRARWRRVAAHLTRPEIAATALASYRYERWTELAMPIAGTLLEGGFIGVIADKLYHVHPSVLALITAAPMFGLLSSVLWARLAVGRRKVPFITALMTGFVGCVATISVLPNGPLGPWLLVGSQIVARLILGGIITIRSVIWTLNYPHEARARVTSRLQILTILTMTLTSLLGGLLLDADPASFRIVYGVGAAVSVLGVLSFSRVRLMGEDAQITRERTMRHAETGATAASLASAWHVLRHDPLYARYQGCQFLIGVANMMIEAPLIYLVSRELQASYATSIALTLGIPLALSMLTLPLWAIYVDRVHISEFRARLNMPARISIVPDLVDREDLLNATAISQSVMNTGRILGPSFAGGIIEFAGIGHALYINAICYAFGIVFLLMMTGVKSRPKPKNINVFHDIRDALRFVKSTPIVYTIIGMGFSFGFFGASYIQVLPAFGKEVLRLNAGGAGVMMSVTGIGSLVGSLTLASLGNVSYKNFLLLGMIILFGVSLFIFAWSPWYIVSLGILFFVGMGFTGFTSMATTILQLSTPPELREG